MKRFLVIIFVFIYSALSAFSAISCSAPVQPEMDEMRACWVCSVGNLDFPSKPGLKKNELKAEIDRIVSACSARGINTVFFQVRPNGDALYRSGIFPWSIYVSGMQGAAPDQGFDPLGYFIEKAHAAGVELHAWINPYRIGTGDQVEKSLAENNPALLHPEYVLKTSKGLYYNPGIPAVRQLIIRGVAEIVKNYEVDGIHFDDYFYPSETAEINDQDTFTQYGNQHSIEDFRRESVNSLIRNTFTTVKTLRSSCKFGVSPRGIWANRRDIPEGSETNGGNSYFAIFCDSKKWVEEGWVDYICPQIYWSFDLSAAPYGTLVDWWDRLCTKENVDLCVGLAAYKLGTEEIGWADPTILEREIKYAAQKKSYIGYSLFRYGSVMEHGLDFSNIKSEPARSETAAEVPASAGIGTQKSLTPSQTEKIEVPAWNLPDSNSLNIHFPANGETFDSGYVSVAGAAPAGESVWINGVQATVSSDGLYAGYVPLDYGENRITVRAGDLSKSIAVTRTRGGNTPLNGFKEGSNYPGGAVICGAGAVLSFSVTAETGASVTLTNGVIRIPLAETESNVYRGELTAPALPFDERTEFGDFRYELTGKSGTAVLNTDLSITVFRDGYKDSGFLQTDAYIFDDPVHYTQMEHDPLPQGHAVTVVEKADDMLRLENGFWILAETFGGENPEPLQPFNYSCDTVELTADGAFPYYTVFSGNEIRIELSVSRQKQIGLLCSDTLQAEIRRRDGHTRITIPVKEYRLAGYETISTPGRLRLRLHSLPQSIRNALIVLDPGHGGEDSGALSPGGAAYPSESYMNLLLANDLKESLEKAGAKVILLRSDDREILLQERVEICKDYAPDLFISLHYNSTDLSADFTKASGGLALYSSPLSLSFAESIAHVLREGVDGLSDVKRQSLRVCRRTQYPAVLIEAGYMCNPIEFQKMCRRDIRLKIADNITEAVKTYLISE